MARILAVDDEPAITIFTQEVLRAEGYDVAVANHPAVALRIVDELASRGETIDLVLSDVNMPEMDGFALRAEIRKRPGFAKVPVVFLSGADPVAEMSIARWLEGDRLLIKPAPSAELLRVVRVALGSARGEKGILPGGLDGMLVRIGEGKETGVLTVSQATVVKRFVFQNGNLAFAASSDPRDLIGQAMLRAGVITEKDLLLAFAAAPSGDAKAPQLAAALTALRKLTREQCEKVFFAKIKESVLDVFLWKGGAAEMLGGALEENDAPFPIALELAPLLAEGNRRRQKWKEVERVLPDPSLKLERVGQSWPAGFPKNVGDEHLAKQIERGQSLAEISVELRGQAYAVGVRIAELIKAGAVRAVADGGFSGFTPQDPSPDEIERAHAELDAEPSMPAANADALAAWASAPAPSPSPGDTPTIAALTEGLIRFRAGDLGGARQKFVEVLTADPLNALARQRLNEVDQAIASAARAAGLANEARISLAVPVQKLVGQKLDAGDAFVLSRLAAGTLTVADLLHVCPIPEHEVLSVIDRYLASGLLRRS